MLQIVARYGKTKRQIGRYDNGKTQKSPDRSRPHCPCQPAARCRLLHLEQRRQLWRQGAPLSGSTLKQVECGKTTNAWVLATLGEPSEQSTTDTGSEILKYKYSRNQESNVVMPFVIVNDENKKEQTVYFQVKDGVVQRYWVETAKK